MLLSLLKLSEKHKMNKYFFGFVFQTSVDGRDQLIPLCQPIQISPLND